jgi:hypothetical protein
VPDSGQGDVLRAQLRDLHQRAGSPTTDNLKEHADRSGHSVSRSALATVLSGTQTMRWATVAAFVDACASFAARRRSRLPSEVVDLARWRQSFDRVSPDRRLHSSERNKVTHRWQLFPVSECQPGWVGVHPASTRSGSTSEISASDDPPRYIRRDHDAELHRRLRALAITGGFLVLIGNSSVGKTRTLYEAIREVLPDWNLLLPDDAAAVRSATDVLPPRTVVWLDDTPSERYLTEDGQGGLSRSDMVRLLAADGSAGPFILVDMLWRTNYQTLAATPRSGDRDRYRNARELLKLAGEPVNVSDQFSKAERKRAAKHVNTDVRIADALEDTQFGFTQHLAGAPELVRRWRDATPYAKAVITAAIDARRLAIRGPLDMDLLRHGAVGYLSDRQRATANDDWFDTALHVATEPSLGTTAPLLPEPDDELGIGSIAGYTVADFLEQYGQQQRYFEPIPALLWDALIDHVTDPVALRHVGSRAHARTFYSHAEQLYVAGLNAGDRKCQDYLIDLLAQQNRDEDLRTFVTHDYEAEKELARILYWQGREDELRSLAASGRADTVSLLVDLLADQGRVDEAFAEARKWATKAAGLPEPWLGSGILPRLLQKFDRIEELHTLADPDAQPFSEGWFAYGLLTLPLRTADTASSKRRQGNQDLDVKTETETPLLSETQLDETIKQFRTRITKGEEGALKRLIQLAGRHGLVDELRILIATTGDLDALTSLWDLLQQLDRHDELATFVRFGLNPDGTFAQPPKTGQPDHI